MTPRKNLFAILLVIVLACVACQQKKNKKQSLRSGRNARGFNNSNFQANPSALNGAGQCGSMQGPSNKTWGDVTPYQGDFQQEVQILTNPTMAGASAEDLLGSVRSVYFWGNATIPCSGYGPMNPATAQIRLEIFDDKACQVKSDGTVRPMIPIHIGPQQPGFVSAEGFVNGGQARLTYTDTYGSIVLEGTISNGRYSGNMLYTTYETGGQPRVLGRFDVLQSGFFSCQ